MLKDCSKNLLLVELVSRAGQLFARPVAPSKIGVLLVANFAARVAGMLRPSPAEVAAGNAGGFFMRHAVA